MRRTGTVTGLRAGSSTGLASRARALAWWGAATLVATASVVLLLVGLLPSSGTSPASQVPPDAAREALIVEALTFDHDLLADVAAYRTPRRALTSASRLIGVAVPLTIGLALLSRQRTGRSARLLAPWLRSLGRLPGAAVQVGGAGAIVVLATALVRLPVSVAAGVVQDGVWGFRTRSVPGWALDHLLVVTGRALGVGVLVAAVTALVLRHPRTRGRRV
jgi:hypothetical protein